MAILQILFQHLFYSVSCFVILEGNIFFFSCTLRFTLCQSAYRVVCIGLRRSGFLTGKCIFVGICVRFRQDIPLAIIGKRILFFLYSVLRICQADRPPYRVIGIRPYHRKPLFIFLTVKFQILCCGRQISVCRIGIRFYGFQLVRIHRSAVLCSRANAALYRCHAPC